MKVRPEQLKQHFKSEFAAIYFVFGDEPLQVMESVDQIRAQARAQGYSEREVMDVDAQFDWNQLLDAANSLSLFAEKRILELRLPTGKPGKVGGKILQAYAQRPADDAVLIINSGKLESSSKNAKWFKTLDQQGVVIQCWPVNIEQLPNWINLRLQSKGIHADKEAVQLLSSRMEGNLLAAAQEVDKLFLLHGAGKLSIEKMELAVSDSARFTIYDLVDSALSGNVTRSARIVGGLKKEGVEPVLMLWALSREVRLLAKIAMANTSIDAAMSKQRIWDSRKALIRRALARHSAGRWTFFLKRCAKIDRVIKGVEPGKAWDELLMLTTQLAQ